MDVAALSINYNQFKLSQEANIALMKVAMDTNKQSSNEMIKTLQKSIDPNLGKYIDASV